MAIFTGDFTCHFSSISTFKSLFTTRQILPVQEPLNPNYNNEDLSVIYG